MTQTHKEIFQDVYRYFSKIENPQNTEEFWFNAADNMEELVKKYNCDKLAIKLLVACYEYANETIKDIKQKGKKND